jgi:hypothetical protein
MVALEKLSSTYGAKLASFFDHPHPTTPANHVIPYGI